MESLIRKAIGKHLGPGLAAALIVGLFALPASASAESRQAYCWGHPSNQAYKCYGPVQLLWSWHDDLATALQRVGCSSPSLVNPYDRMGRGARNGVWFNCVGPLNGYDNAPSKIRNWIASQ